MLFKSFGNKVREVITQLSTVSDLADSCRPKGSEEGVSNEPSLPDPVYDLVHPSLERRAALHCHYYVVRGKALLQHQ